MNKLALVGLALMLSGCAAMREADTATVLRAAPAFEALAPAGGEPVAVAPVLAEGVAGDRRYAYVDRAAPGEVRQAATLFWEDSPARMLERALVDGLRARLGAAVGPGVSVETGRRVTARLERFEERTGGGTQAQASVVFDALVTQGRALRLTGRYCGRAVIASDSPTSRAQAFEAALAAAVVGLADDVRAGAASRTC